MKRASLTQYDEFPEEMLIYMRNYGPHFNKKLFKFAVSNMTKREGGVERPITPMTREEVEALLGRNEVTVERGQLYDCTYVANMCKADFLGSSVADEKHMALYIKDVIDEIAYNTEYKAVNWENSSIRKWLKEHTELSDEEINKQIME